MIDRSAASAVRSARSAVRVASSAQASAAWTDRAIPRPTRRILSKARATIAASTIVRSSVHTSTAFGGVSHAPPDTAAVPDIAAELDTAELDTAELDTGETVSGRRAGVGPLSRVDTHTS
jgi:hypothetical protein